MNSLNPQFVAAGERENGCACAHCGHTVLRGEQTAVCQACGTVHHVSCWTQRGRCGSYACAPARVDVAAARSPAWQISADEIGCAVPLPPRRPATAAPPNFQMPLPRTNRLAIAALVTALAGILFFGAVTGLVAILLGSLALGSLRGARQRGTGLAVTGILLGLVDVVGWLVWLATLFSGPTSHVALDDLQNDPAALEGLEPALNRAMRATVLLESPRGAFRGGTVVGSGVILNLKGREALLVTNRHVIDPNFSGAELDRRLEGLPQVQVHFIGHAIATGTVIWLAPHGIDLALVRVQGETEEARAAQWQPKHPVHVGTIVHAIGNPHRLGWTHTQGVVSQLRLQPTDGPPVHVIQTQAALNPGNSGGGLFDRDGFLVGINTWTNDKRISEGLGFAISLDTLLELNPPALAGLAPVAEKR